MKVSICICLYNGIAYVEQQLLSILHQTYVPDEVILCDDCSTDGTVRVVKKFIQQYNLLESWKIIINDQKKGYPANFYYCMSLCSGDIVFLCDQDDIWAEQKLEKMVSVFEFHPEANVVACRFGLIDKDGNKIYSFLHSFYRKRTPLLQPVPLRNIFYRYEWPGMVLAYRNIWYHSFMNDFVQIPHDIFLCAKAAEKGSFFQLNELLAFHRRHNHNTALEEHRIKKLLNKKRKLWEIENYLKMLDQFDASNVLTTSMGQQVFATKKKAMQDRYYALHSGKISNVIVSALKNHKSVRIATFFCDMMIAHQ